MPGIIIKHRTTGAVLYDAPTAVTLRDAVEAAVASGANLVGANLVGANLGGTSLDGANLDGASLFRANLFGANLVGANLVRANLDGAYLVGANLGGASLVGTSLFGANLDGAYLVGANLVGANLGGASLVGTSLFGANLVGANLDDKPFGGVVSIGPIGSRSDTLTVIWTTDGEATAHVGCFTGTLDEFAAAVEKTHGASKYGDEYRAAIALVRARITTLKGRIWRDLAWCAALGAGVVLLWYGCWLWAVAR